MHAFNRLFGTTQGRIEPVGVTPVGSFSFVLGSDLPGVKYTFNTGDKVVVAQTATTTGLKLMRFAARMRAPTPPIGFGYTWRFSWGIDGAVQAFRNLRAGKTIDMVDGVFDLSQLAAGNHSFEFTLAVLP